MEHNENDIEWWDFQAIELFSLSILRKTHGESYGMFHVFFLNGIIADEKAGYVLGMTNKQWDSTNNCTYYLR